MKTVMIRLSTVKDVQRFVGAITPLKGDFELVSGRFVLDARSLMGILGFDLSAPLCLRIYSDSPETMQAIHPYRADIQEDHYGQ
ncbi:MAG: HPr family phosphocarrier protein [Clostridia bacterium]|nr:HPr family phosphocarrier protein [Clostridia bacterium]